MEDIVLRHYQEDVYNEIIDNQDVRHLIVCVPCGGGKSILIGKLATELPGRTLVLTHRIELLVQNAEWIKGVAVLTSQFNTLRYDSRVIIASIETLNARIKNYGVKYLGDFNNIIIDECHVDIFKKVYSKLKYDRIIGFTATPLTNKRELKVIDGVEYTRPLSMANEYDKLITGIDVQDLVDDGYLNQDYNIVLRLPDIDKLRHSDSDPDGYTKASVNEVYQNTASYEILLKGYNEYAKGKKTMIFNANSKINKGVYDYFKEHGINCQMFDSVNDTEMSRAEIVKWFSETPDAVLINANVFTTGFNDPEVEVIMLNRATKSLSLYLQMTGRGARITNRIYKDKFTVIDLGENILEHGPFSQRRNWHDYFTHAMWKRKVTMDLLKTWECTYCGAINVIGEEFCGTCGALKEDVVVGESTKKLKTGEFEALTDMPLPKARNIIDYSIAQKQGSVFAFKLLEEKIVELFIHYKVSKGFYQKKREDFHIRIKQIATPIYFAIMKEKRLQGPKRTIDTTISKIYSRIDKLYLINENAKI
jgi:superfamily II DNA or RNA helicase